MPAIFPPHRSVKLEPRVELDVVGLRKKVWTKGTRLYWEHAALCPCRQFMTADGVTGDSTENQTDCLECEGRGTLLHSGQVIRGVFLGAERTQELFSVYGGNSRGVARVTTLPENLLGPEDRITCMEHVVRYRETLERSALAVDSARYRILSRTFTVADPADATVLVELTRGTLMVRIATPAGVLVPGERVEGVDFTVTADGRVDWSLGDGLATAPAVGARYSLSYFKRPVYRTLNIPYVYRLGRTKYKRPDVVPRSLLVLAELKLEWLGNFAGTVPSVDVEALPPDTV